MNLKKFFLLLLIFALSVFFFIGCDILPPSGTEGEGEPEGISVEIENYYKAPDGKIYVAGGTNKITVTFPAPVANAVAYITDCTGDYSSKQMPTNDDGTPVVLFPNEDKTVWTGSGTFGCPEITATEVPVEIASGRNGDYSDCSGCCASYIMVKAGECEDDFCIQFPVIVDFIQPYATLEISTESCDDPCAPGNCAITFKSTEDADPCGPGEQCCGDDCSGLDGWSIAIYKEDPFDECCLTPCYEPIFTESGTGCPIEVTTVCLGDDEIYYVVVDMVDNVGNETNYYATIEMESTCLPDTADFELALGDSSYFQVTVTDFMSEGDEEYPGWCTDAYTFISTGEKGYNANIYPSIFLPENFCAANVGNSASWNSETWSQINWILNHWTTFSATEGTLTWQEVQSAIWDLIHRNVCVEDPDSVVGWVCVCDDTGSTPLGNVEDENVEALLEAACNNTGYVPGPDDLVAVVLLEGGNCPDYADPVRCVDGVCSPRWDGGSSSNPDAVQMIIIEVLRSEVDCPPCEIVEVLEYATNDLGCTDWEKPTEKPDFIIGDCGIFSF